MDYYDNIFGAYECKIQDSQKNAEQCYSEVMGDQYEGDVRKHADKFYWHHSSKHAQVEAYFEIIEGLSFETFNWRQYLKD